MTDNNKFHYMFVYGTLKKGEPNYHVLTNEKNGFSEFVGWARTVEKYPLVIASKYNIPFLLDLKYETGQSIVGEVYRVDDAMLSVLDELENHPDFYIRRQDPVRLKISPDFECNFDFEGSKPISCWIYFLPNFNRDMLSLPLHSDYSSTGDHGLPYVPRYKRAIQNYSPKKDVKINSN